MFAFGYRFRGRSIKDLKVMDDRIIIWLAEDKTHKGEDQTIVVKDRAVIQLVRRMHRWLDYLAQGRHHDGAGRPSGTS